MVSDIYRTWVGRRICNVDSLIDALKYARYDRRAKAYAKDCLIWVPDWAWSLIDKLVREQGLEKELDEIINEIYNDVISEVFND